MCKYDIVFIDIDGTLRDSNKKLRDITIDSIKKIREKGIKVVLCTGRSHKYAVRVAKEANTSEYVISSSGSEVTNILTNEVIYNSAISKDTLNSVYEYCKQKELNLLLNTISGDYQTIDESYNRVLINDISEVKDDVNQIVITSMNYNRMLVIPNMFKVKYPDINCNASSPDLKNGVIHPKIDFFHDFNNKGISKASGIVALLEYLNIPVEKSVVIGDSQNDIPMFEIAGYSVAMGNAIDNLKAIANEVAETNDNNGVAKFLDSLA